MHNGLLRLGEEKMSKSLGNLITIRSSRAAEDSMEAWLQHLGLM